MHSAIRRNTKLTGRAALATGIAALILAVTGVAVASLCAWRNPEADIQAFFGGGNYRTVVADLGNKRSTIEQRIGAPLDNDEQHLKFWPITKDGQRVGTVAALRGQVSCCSGPIEVVVAIVDPPDGPAKIKAVRMQQDGGQYGDALRSGAFLDQFKGKQANSKLKVGVDVNAASPKAAGASQIVALACKKLLVAYEELGIASR